MHAPRYLSNPALDVGEEAGMMGFDEIGLVLETFVRKPGDVAVKIVSSGGIVGWMSREWLEVVG